MSNLQNIVVAGYMATGGTAVVDLLKEFENILYPEVEFRLIKERHGLLDLEFALCDNWSFHSVDFAIKDFLWLSKIHYRNHTIFSKFGYSYSKLICSEFINYTNNFINNLVDFKYYFNWAYYDFDSFCFIPKKIIKIILWKFFKISVANKFHIAYFSKWDRLTFIWNLNGRSTCVELMQLYLTTK